MKIHDDHLYHGAALIQIAEHPQFTAINSLKVKGEVVRAAYKINAHIAVYLKYAAKTHGRFKEYVFTFHTDHLETIEALADANPQTFIVLVCVKGRHICCIKASELSELIESRKEAAESEEDSYTVLVTMRFRKKMQVYMNQPGKKKTMLGRPLTVSRRVFPDVLFG